jgi:hypothetical protein
LQSSSAPRWRSIAPNVIACREWDGEFVVRNERTGNSHLLGTLAGRVLGVLLDAGEPLVVAEIAARVEKAFPQASTGGEAAAIEKTLAEFQRLGLAEPETT